MNRLSSKLVELKNSNQKALVAYLVAGDPDLDTTLELMHLFVESGVDVIEIGVPFTDPIAEGPTIQRAHDRALKNDISLKMILDLVKKFRTVDQETPIVLMGYLNTFISHIDLVKSADSNSVDSILVVDVPGELNLETYGISNPNINTISLISPTTKEDRVESIAKNSTGFIYYVNLRGVTGSSNLNIDEIQKNIARIQQYTDLPTMAGFGIKSIEDAKTLAACSDGIVIGSSIVEMIDEESTTKEFGRISNYLREMKTAIS
ncbi:tryptophan synthase subunit alpha [Gammaproteobacteria bacterium]|nr:tryptophan synthase subunit alpha [Gammaproteobacteria bacterium]